MSIAGRLIHGVATIVAGCVWVAICFFDYMPPAQLTASITFLVWCLVSGDKAFK